MFHYTVETEKSPAEAIASLEEHLQKEQFGVLWKFNVKEKLQEKGADFEQDYFVLEVCNPHEAKRVLSKNELAGYFLPCKLVVYESDGKTKIGLPKPSSLIRIADDLELEQIAGDIEERFIAVINKSK